MPINIAELQRKRAALATQLTAIVTKEAELPDDEEMSKEDMDQFEAIKAAIAAMDARIARVEAATSLAAESMESEDEDDSYDGKSAKPRYVKSDTARVYAEPKKHFERKQPGEAGVRFVAGLIRGKHVGGEMAAQGIIEATGDREVAYHVKNALASNVQALGLTLIPEDFRPELIELLRSRTVYDRIGAMDVDLPNGALVMPRLADTVATTWGAENTDIPLSNPSFGEMTLNAKKLVTRVEISNELISRSPLAVEAIVRTDMIESATRTIDRAFFESNGTLGSPVGMLHAPGRVSYPDITVGGTSAVTLDVATAYIRGMVATLERTNSRMIAPFWTFHSDVKHFLSRLRDGVGGFPFAAELDRENPTLLGIPVYLSTQHVTNLASVVPGGTAGTRLYLGDAADIVRAREGALMVDTSTEAGTAFARFQTWVRFVQFMDVGFRQPQSTPVIGRVDNWR